MEKKQQITFEDTLYVSLSTMKIILIKIKVGRRSEVI